MTTDILHDRRTNLIKLIRASAKSDTIDELEFMFDVVQIMSPTKHKDELDQLIFDLIRRHKAY